MTLYRPADLAPDSDERTFVISTWSSSYKASHFAGMISSEDWATVMHAQIGKLLDRAGTRTLVAAERSGFLYGFIAGNTTGPLPIVHYVYVKDPFRELGHAGRLFLALDVDPDQPFLYTCKTAIVVQRLAGKIPRATFAPAAARHTDYHHQEHHGQRRP